MATVITTTFQKIIATTTSFWNTCDCNYDSFFRKIVASTTTVWNTWQLWLNWPDQVFTFCHPCEHKILSRNKTKIEISLQNAIRNSLNLPLDHTILSNWLLKWSKNPFWNSVLVARQWAFQIPQSEETFNFWFFPSF